MLPLFASGAGASFLGGASLRATAARTASSPAVMMSPETHGNVHGRRCYYVGGRWVPLEECGAKFNIADGSQTSVAATPCPRSRTRHTAAKDDGTYHVRLRPGSVHDAP